MDNQRPRLMCVPMHLPLRLHRGVGGVFGVVLFTGVYPAMMRLGWSSTMTCASKFPVGSAGSFLASDATMPRLISFTDTFFTLKPTLSPEQ
jgi:hypothetical protein